MRHFRAIAFVTVATLGVLALPCVRGATVANEGSRIEIDGRPIDAEKFRDLSFASFTLTQPTRITVRAASPIKSFNLSPHSASIMAHASDATLSFKVDRPRHLVLTINDRERVFLFAEPLAPDRPKPGKNGVVNVLDFGVDATGQRLETMRLQQAIDRVAAAKGTLYFPAGVYLTGTLSLKSDLTLHLAEGARLLGSSNPDDYPPDPGNDEAHTPYQEDVVRRTGRYDAAYRRLLLIDHAKNVRVTGRGIIEGQGKLLRPKRHIMFILVRESSDVAFEDITLLDSPLYNAHVVGSDRITFRRLKIVSDQEVHNTDGIDPDSSRDVLIEDCFFCCADDCIAIKTSGQSGVKGDAERITARNCVFITRTSAVKIGTENFVGRHRDFTFENIDVLEADRAVNISSDGPHGYEHLRFVDWRIERLLGRRLQFPVHVHVEASHLDSAAGWIRDVRFENVSVEPEYPSPSKLAGFSRENDVHGIRFVNYRLAGRVRLNAADARVDIGPFVSDVTFAAPAQQP